MVLKAPTGELVAVAYGKRVLAEAGLAGVPVVTTLPPVDSWAATGAVQVGGIVGGVSRETALRDTVVSYEGWAARPGSDKPPWGQANGLLAALLDSAFWDWLDAMPLDLEPAGIYRPVLIQSVTVKGVQGEPRRLPDPDTSRAHYTMDLRIFWTVA